MMERTRSCTLNFSPGIFWFGGMMPSAFMSSPTVTPCAVLTAWTTPLTISPTCFS
jgi:hypothetical protein